MVSRGEECECRGAVSQKCYKKFTILLILICMRFCASAFSRLVPMKMNILQAGETSRSNLFFLRRDPRHQAPSSFPLRSRDGSTSSAPCTAQSVGSRPPGPPPRAPSTQVTHTHTRHTRPVNHPESHMDTLQSRESFRSPWPSVNNHPTYYPPRTRTLLSFFTTQRNSRRNPLPARARSPAFRRTHSLPHREACAPPP